MKLSEFREIIQGQFDSFRPFLCHGNPLACDVIAIGSEPVHRDENFWQYWCDSAGFDYVAYIEKRSKLSKTRQKLNLLASFMGKVQMLDTNVREQEELVSFLLRTIEPLVVIPYTLDALKSTRKTFDLPHLGFNQVNECNPGPYGYKMLVITPKPRFSAASKVHLQEVAGIASRFVDKESMMPCNDR